MSTIWKGKNLWGDWVDRRLLSPIRGFNSRGKVLEGKMRKTNCVSILFQKRGFKMSLRVCLIVT